MRIGTVFGSTCEVTLVATFDVEGARQESPPHRVPCGGELPRNDHQEVEHSIPRENTCARALQKVLGDLSEITTVNNYARLRETRSAT